MTTPEPVTVVTPVAPEPEVAPEVQEKAPGVQAVAPEVQEEAPGVPSVETVTAPVTAVETPVAETADGEAAQPTEPVAQPSQY